VKGKQSNFLCDGKKAVFRREASCDSITYSDSSLNVQLGFAEYSFIP
jgi:hypothetical protein